MPETRKLHSLTNTLGTNIVNIKIFCAAVMPAFMVKGNAQMMFVLKNWKGFDLIKNKFTNPDSTA